MAIEAVKTPPMLRAAPLLVHDSQSSTAAVNNEDERAVSVRSMVSAEMREARMQESVT